MNYLFFLIKNFRNLNTKTFLYINNINIIIIIKIIIYK
jgi:hypothetical protein